MHRHVLIGAAALAIATPALAQVVQSPGGPAVVVRPAEPAVTGGVLTPQKGSTGGPAATSFSPTGQPADVISNDSAAAGNSSQPTRVAPQGSGGGSDGAGGGG